jgi:oligoendopeptidase F
MAKKRSEIANSDKWNVSAIFNSVKSWETELTKLSRDINEISRFKGTLNSSADNLVSMLDTSFALDRRIDLLYTYAHMRHDEDLKNEECKSMYDRAVNLYIEYGQVCSWITPELLEIDSMILDGFLADDKMAGYRFYFEKILRTRPHVRNSSEEELLSMADQVLIVPHDVFSGLNDGDITFGEFEINGKSYELTHGEYRRYLISRERQVRETAFIRYHEKYDDLPLTFANLLYGQVKAHVFKAKVRNFPSTLDAALFYKNIDPAVYINLIDTVHKRIHSLHNYLELRKKSMKVDQLHLYDVYVPFVDSPDISMSFDEARDNLLEAVKPLGKEYCAALHTGMHEKGWVDKFENSNKRSGAYSTGCYDSEPYILMNYNDTLSSARTLAHEAGHSMHSWFTHKYQPPVYGNYSIFVAEVASTFNEELFNSVLMQKNQDPAVRAYLVNSRIEEIRTTLFRQTMFAEFELKIHQLVEQGQPLTPQLLKDEYRKLNEFYFGTEVIIDPSIEIEWARIPHFYYNYYVYQYATGISAAIALSKRVLEGGESEREDYLGFLKSGSSKYPVDTLKDAGVDMTSPQPVEAAIDYFDSLLTKLEELL